MSSLPPSEPSPAPTNKRPAQVASLMHGGEVYHEWYGANWRSNRFYVLNIEQVIPLIGYQHTNGKAVFEKAKTEIADNTDWRSQYPFEFGCAYSSAYPLVRNNAKEFPDAVVMMIALELWALEHGSATNVWDHLRILPAQYFVDGFDKKRLGELTKHHSAMTDAEKAENFGADSSLGFDKLCLKRMQQRLSDGLLLQMTSGMCVTKYVANNLRSFINTDAFPENLHLGDVLPAGSPDATSVGLGRKNAASALRIPQTVPPASLVPPYLA